MHGKLVPTAPPEGMIQTFTPDPLFLRLFYLAPYLETGGTTQQAPDVQHNEKPPLLLTRAQRRIGYSRQPLDCARNHTWLERKWRLELFANNGPFEFIAMDILSTFPNTATGNPFIMFNTDRYKKLNQAT